MSEKMLLKLAKIVSAVFSPFFAPAWAVLGLFAFSYLSFLDTSYQIMVLGVVLLFTVVVPLLSITIFRVMNKWTHWQLSKRKNRFLPYVITLISYLVCLEEMSANRMPMFFRGIILAAIVSMALCFIINIWWKISTHMVGMGGLVGSVFAFSNLLGFNPLIPSSVLIVISGFLGTSRIILRQHSLMQVFVGFIVGFLSAFYLVLFVI